MTERHLPQAFKKVMRKLPPCLAIGVKDVIRPLEFSGKCTATDGQGADACCGIVAVQLNDHGRLDELGDLQRNATASSLKEYAKALALGADIFDDPRNLNLG